MAKKGKSKKQGNPNISTAKKNGVFSPKRDLEKGQSHAQKASTRSSTRLAGQNSRKS
jgi:hypothetical protein